MPAIQFGCPQCKATVHADSRLVGQETPCPTCGKLVLIAPPMPPNGTRPPLPGALVGDRPPPLGVPPPVGAPPIREAPPVAKAPPIFGAPPVMPGPVMPGPLISAPPPVAPMTSLAIPPLVVSAPAPISSAVISPASLPVTPVGRPVLGGAAGPSTANPPLIVAPSQPQSLPREGDRASRRLASDEREQRRLRRNIVTATVGVLLLLLLMTILMKIAG